MTEKELMTEALALAKLSFDEGEVPVGAVVTRNGEIVSVGRNRREKDKNALAHAEIEAIDRACKALGGWRLWECELFVTLEPCPMCAGAILNSRLSRIVYGSPDKRFGGCGTTIDVVSDNALGVKVQVTGGVKADECLGLIRAFFMEMRSKKGDSGAKTPKELLS